MCVFINFTAHNELHWIWYFKSCNFLSNILCVTVRSRYNNVFDSHVLFRPPKWFCMDDANFSSLPFNVSVLHLNHFELDALNFHWIMWMICYSLASDFVCIFSSIQTLSSYILSHDFMNSVIINERFFLHRTISLLCRWICVNHSMWRKMCFCVALQILDFKRFKTLL